AQAYFFCTLHRPGGGEIDIVDPGDEQHEHGNNAEKVGRASAAIRLKFAHIVRVEVDVVNALQVELHPGIELFEPLSGKLIDQGRDLCLKYSGVYPLIK